MRQTQSAADGKTISMSLAEAKLSKQGFHFLIVEKENAYKFLDKASLLNPEEPMYQECETNESLAMTGNRKMVMLRCSIEDYNEHIKRAADESDAALKRVEPGEKLEQKAVISVEP